jgi:hypothetical protein
MSAHLGQVLAHLFACHLGTRLPHRLNLALSASSGSAWGLSRDSPVGSITIFDGMP